MYSAGAWMGLLFVVKMLSTGAPDKFSFRNKYAFCGRPVTINLFSQDNP